MSAPGARNDFTDDELLTWSSLATVLEWLPAALDAQLQSAELTHFEYGILYALSVAPDRTLRMSTLASYANSSLSRLSRAVARLEKRHWVGRGPDPRDGRYTLATLTGAGVDKVEQATPRHVQTVQRLVFEPLTQAQTRQLREISRRISSAIRAEEGWSPAAENVEP
jgi:DNA-binding MarR family transcriptional regulator